MEFNESYILSIVLFFVGAALGALISRMMLPSKQNKSLENQLQASQEKLDSYQKEVSEHFEETSKLVQNLTQSYKDVHDHLAKGAGKLATAEVSEKMLSAGNPQDNALENQSTLDENAYAPPKDWAPKTPGETGMLSEEFGLKEEAEDPSIEELTAANTITQEINGTTTTEKRELN